MEKTITIDGQEIKFKATASTPRVYRQAFGRDIYIDMTRLYDDMAKGETMSVENLEAFEDMAFCMYSQAIKKELHRETIENDINDWLDQFSTFSIYKIAPQLMELWKLTTEQTVKPKNQVARPNDQ